MATPQNKLDHFVTYIPHYELHVASDWPALKAIESVDHNASTTPTNATDTLLINTRKDAHQQIDDIRFSYACPNVEPSGAMHPISALSMTIIEPNGTSFIEKLQNVQTKYQVNNIMASLTFGLKIFFVGRDESGADVTIPFSKIIPLHIATLDAKFSHKGGEYHLTFNTSGSVAASTATQPNNGLSRSIAYTNKNISFKSSTVQDSIKQLEAKLNQNYEDLYTTELINSNGSKPLTYRIILDPDIAGNVYLSTKDSYGSGELCQLTFTNEEDIGSMIKSILHSSKEVNEMIAGSKDGISKQFHPNVRMPVIQCSYLLLPGKVEVTYNVQLYKGGREEQNTFEFDYYFSGPGKNVDVLEFEIRFPSMLNWMSSTIAGTNLHFNNDSNIPSTEPDSYSKNTIHEDTTREICYAKPHNPVNIPALKNDVALTAVVNSQESKGYAKYQAAAVPAARLAFETVGLACGAINNQLIFSIRGHYQLLERVILYPDPSEITPIGINNGAWIKVNIFNSDGTAFFYTGFYTIFNVENVFHGGKFTQNITVMMNDRD
jgi:hypothetical protein